MKTEETYTDKELIEKVLNKETAIFELIIRRNNPYLYRIGRMYHFNHEDTQDLMQETYIEVYIHLHQFEGRSSFRAWISRIMIHNAITKHRNGIQRIWNLLKATVRLLKTFIIPKLQAL
ncbi:sigma factor [Sphingobacterium multivorum]|uniref:sigma factor n=1 Tax=Sphingobacterium multivorum TaxID=28454 RepID=UPI0028AFB878|nr:sigma factor [Sphingobacterium multivorum]